MAAEQSMPSLSEECNPAKARYDSCFNDWFKGSFLKGKDDHEAVCGEFFTAYQECLQKSLQEKGLIMAELRDDILGTSKEKIPPK